MFIKDARIDRVEAEQSAINTGNVTMDVTFHFDIPTNEATSIIAALSNEAEAQTLEIGNLPASIADL